MTQDIAWPEVHWPSKINSWEGWPDDVREVLRSWNKKGDLSFRGLWYWSALGSGYPAHVFKCSGCGEFHIPHKHGKAVYKGDPYCDPCMIELARSSAGSTL